MPGCVRFFAPNGRSVIMDFMLATLLSVTVISFSGVLMPGPMFALTLSRSYHTPWAGAQIVLGHVLVELPIILLIYFGFAGFFELVWVQILLSLAGGIMIIYMGLGMIKARREAAQDKANFKYNTVVSGAAMSALNPFFLVWWATVGAMLVMKVSDYGLGGLGALAATHWLVDLAWLCLVSFIVYRTHRLWGSRVREIVFIGCGLLLAAFGVYFIVSGLKLWL